MLGGVSGGLAEYTGIDALLWRVGFIALVFAGGTGVVVYLLLWVLMPRRQDGEAAAAAPARVEAGPPEPRSPSRGSPWRCC
ncbi:PspC domain-containing protein [Klenkia terrae]|uniref:PspC domain-containing protein n=1 Tax=Klenkia terrae TaxID=1052259 RepID=UPI0036222787